MNDVPFHVTLRKKNSEQEEGGGIYQSVELWLWFAPHRLPPQRPYWVAACRSLD